MSAVSGSVFLVLIAYFCLHSTESAKEVTKDLALLLGLLVFFGVFVDMVHVALPLRGMNLIEDGGEMISMSLITSYVVDMLEQRHTPGLLWQLTRGVLTAPWARCPGEHGRT
ncbi:MAG: hypothetical protein AB1898_26135 [Acidobacteriota bacterium]